MLKNLFKRPRKTYEPPRIIREFDVLDIPTYVREGYRTVWDPKTQSIKMVKDGEKKT